MSTTIPPFTYEHRRVLQSIYYWHHQNYPDIRAPAARAKNAQGYFWGDGAPPANWGPGFGLVERPLCLPVPLFLVAAVDCWIPGQPIDLRQAIGSLYTFEMDPKTKELAQETKAPSKYVGFERVRCAYPLRFEWQMPDQAILKIQGEPFGGGDEDPGFEIRAWQDERQIFVNPWIEHYDEDPGIAVEYCEADGVTLTRIGLYWAEWIWKHPSETAASIKPGSTSRTKIGSSHGLDRARIMETGAPQPTAEILVSIAEARPNTTSDVRVASRIEPPESDAVTDSLSTSNPGTEGKAPANPIEEESPSNQDGSGKAKSSIDKTRNENSSGLALPLNPSTVIGELATAATSPSKALSSDRSKEIPPFDGSDNWIDSNEVNKRELGPKPNTLNTYRKPPHCQWRAKDQSCGVDRDGRKWRRKPDKIAAHIRYYVPTLEAVKKKRANNPL